jgi:hypothetical protein
VKDLPEHVRASLVVVDRNGVFQDAGVTMIEYF